MDTAFRLSLECIDSHSDCPRFRIAFESSADRFLLYYPEVTGLRFTTRHSEEPSTWRTGVLVSTPQDEFVLNPLDRIAFDLRAYINLEPTIERRWTMQLEPGEYNVDYCYTVDPKTRRYDHLGKGSRFADMTKPWSGTVVSNAVRFRVPEIGQRSLKAT